MRAVCWLVLLALLAAGAATVARPGHAAEPTTAPKNLFAPPAGNREVAMPAAGGSVVQRAMRYVQDQQRSLYRRLAGALRSLKTEHTAATVATLLLLSFLYGIFHAVGPGHGKAVISAYLLANERAVKRGIGLSFAASLAQAVSAILLVTTVVFALKGFGITTKQPLGTLMLLSAGFIVVIGAWMLWSSLRGLRNLRGVGRSASASPSSGVSVETGPEGIACGSSAGACGHHHHVQPVDASSRISWAKASSIVAAVGLRPCSGAIFVLLFANTIGLYAAGVWSTLAMALGTALTVSFLAVVTLWSKQAALRLAGFSARWVDWAYAGMGVFGSLAILCLGLLLLFAASSPQTPLSMP